MTDSVRSRNCVSLVLLAKQMWAQVKNATLEANEFERAFSAPVSVPLSFQLLAKLTISFQLQRSFIRYRTQTTVWWTLLVKKGFKSSLGEEGFLFKRSAHVRKKLSKMPSEAVSSVIYPYVRKMSNKCLILCPPPREANFCPKWAHTLEETVKLTASRVCSALSLRVRQSLAWDKLVFPQISHGRPSLEYLPAC